MLRTQLLFSMIALFVGIELYFSIRRQSTNRASQKLYSYEQSYLQHDTLFIGIELRCSSVRTLPPNKTYGVAVFKGSPIRKTLLHARLLFRVQPLFCEVVYLFLYIFASHPVVALCDQGGVKHLKL